MPEESGNPPNNHDETLRRLERRIESLEYAADRENKWWRGGLIAALVLVALSILIAGHHRRHRPQHGMMGMCSGMGMQGHLLIGAMAKAADMEDMDLRKDGIIASGTVPAPTVLLRLKINCALERTAASRAAVPSHSA